MKNSFQTNNNIYIVWKNLFPLEKFQNILENFPDNINFYFMKNSVQTHFNILDSVEKFHLTWKIFQKFWKTFQTI